MSRARRPFGASLRHPITGARFRVSAPTARQLAAYVQHVDTLREGLRLGTTSRYEVDRALRRLVHGTVTVERAARSYMDSGLAPNTRRGIATFLQRAGAPLAAVELEALDGAACARWFASLRGLAPSSAASYWRQLRAIVRHAAERGWISSIPWGSWKPTLRTRGKGRQLREAARDAGELLALLEAARGMDAVAERLQRLGDLEAKIACCALLGLRQGELAGLRWIDVDWAAETITIERQPGGPAERGRDLKTESSAKELRAAPELFPLLQAQRQRLADVELWTEAGPIFPCVSISTPGRPRHYGPRTECLRTEQLRAAVRAAGLPHVDRWMPHSLRDTFVTLEALAHGGDLRAVKERSRHASIGSLLRYLRSRGRELQAPGFTLASGSPPLLKEGSHG